MADRSPDYDLDDELVFDSTDQHRALFEPTRLEIIRLLGQRAATVSQLAEALDRPKGTIGHHVDTLATAGLVRVVRTEQVRAIEAKYWGRTARTFVYGMVDDVEVALPSPFAEIGSAYPTAAGPKVATVRFAQIPTSRADEWVRRLADLAAEFGSEPLDGDTVFGLAIGLWPTDRPTLGTSA